MHHAPQEGLASSAPSSVSCMVITFSVRSLVQSFSVILTILREEDSFTVLMMLKSSMVRYGGGGLWASGTSSHSTCFLYRRLWRRLGWKEGFAAVCRKVVMNPARALNLMECSPRPP